jgi:hypothetical protein
VKKERTQMTTLLDTVELIGDRITEIDMTLARIAPSDPHTAELMTLRLQLDQQQQALLRRAFDENSAQFQSAAAALQTVNQSIGDSLRKIEHLASVIDNVSRLLASVANLVTTVGKLA